LTSFEATHEFLEAWLVDQLLPYCNSEGGLEAAKNGEFRYLPNRARNAIIDELRRRERSKDALDRPVVRMDAPIATEDGDDAHSWHDLLGADCRQEAVCVIGTRPSLEPDALRRKLQQARPELTDKLGRRSFDVFAAVCGLFSDQLSFGDVTRE
jgi:hypothetical protein